MKKMACLDCILFDVALIKNALGLALSEDYSDRARS